MQAEWKEKGTRVQKLFAHGYAKAVFTIYLRISLREAVVGRGWTQTAEIFAYLHKGAQRVRSRLASRARPWICKNPPPVAAVPRSTSADRFIPPVDAFRFAHESPKTKQRGKRVPERRTNDRSIVLQICLSRARR